MVSVGNFTNFILKPVHTYVQEDCLNERGKIDFLKVNPVLFDMIGMQYISIGVHAGRCWQAGRNYRA